MAEDVQVPKLGGVNKKILIGIAVVAGGYVGWRYYQASKANAATADSSTDPGMTDPGTIPSVSGAVQPNNLYGGSTGGGNSTQTSDSSQITTNSQWSQYAIEQLSLGDRWTNSDIAAAVGNYLTGQPLSDEQQVIVRAAIAVAGYPPIGSHSIISGGNTDITIAPTGLNASAVTPTQANINFTAVSGAKTYNVYRAGYSVASGTSTSSPVVIAGLTPNTSYTVTVAAVSASGKVGPKSSPFTFKTSGVSLPKPNTPTAVSILNNRATFKTNTIPYATSYRWFMDGRLVNTTDAAAVTLTNLASRSSHTIAVQVDSTTGNPGPLSAAASFRTK